MGVVDAVGGEPCQTPGFGDDEGQCRYFDACKAGRLACERFVGYVNGEAKGSRVPGRSHYLRLFPGEARSA